MPTDFRQSPQEGENPPPLSWDFGKRLRNKEPYNSDIALCTCRNGHTLRMTSKIHKVAADGTVSPSYVCTYPVCSFHEFVRFVGWDPHHIYEYACPDE